MQHKKTLTKLLAIMISVIMVVGSLPIAVTATTPAASYAPVAASAPAGFVNITVAGTDAVNAYPVFTPTEPIVAYTPVISPNIDGVITYRFSFTPTYHNPASGGSYTRMHILAPGHAGDGRANQLEIPWLRRRAPIEFRVDHANRTFMVLSESFAAHAPNIMYDQWEVGYTYNFVVTMDVSDAANDNITFTIETFDQDGYSFSNPDTSVWTDLPLRTIGQGNQTEYNAGQLTVFAADRLAFADGIGGVTIGRFADANHLSDFVFTVPAADSAYTSAGPQYPTTDITTVLNAATFNVVGSVTYDPIVESDDDGFIDYTFRFTIDELDGFGGDVEIFFVPPNLPAGLANRNALRLNAGIRLAFRNLEPVWAPPYGGVDMLIGNNATNNGAGTSIPGGTFVPEQEYEIFVEVNTNVTPNQFRLTVRESGIANPATILPTTAWQNRFNLENNGVWADFSDGIGAVHVVNNAHTMAVTFNVPAADFLDYEPGTPPPPRDTPMTFQIGPGMEFTDVATFNFNALIPGDIVEIFPNVDNAPYRSTGATAFQHVINISANGTEENPITIRGMANQYGERPVLQGTFRFQHAVVMVQGDHITLDNLVIDGGLLCFLDWLNADAAPDNRFALARGHAPAPAFPNTVLTLDNLHDYFNATVYEEFFHHGSAVNWVVPGAGERYTPHSIMYDDVFHAPRRPAGDTRGINRDHFASRGIFHSGGDGLRVTNSLVIGSGTGLAGSNNGAGHLFVCSSEFGFNGMTLAGHNIYLNSDNARHQDLVVTIQNNFIHNAVGTMGFRTRVARINLHNNFFLDNANGQVDLTTVSLNDNIAVLYNSNNQPPHFSCRFGFRNHNEIMGNLFVLTELFNQDHVSVGGAGMTLEVTHGRYRFVNNTFIALAGGAIGLGWNGGSPNLFIRARFGIESIEMYNNIFYAAFENALVPFGDHIGEACVRARLAQGGTNDDGTTFDASTWYEFNPTVYEGNRNHWRFGERQVAGANNWVSHRIVGTQMPRVVGTEAQRFWWGGVPYEWYNTVRGQQGEDPFVDIANLDFRVRGDSTAAFTGSPVGSYAEFMALEEYNTRLAANEIPVFSSWQITGPTTAIRIEDVTPPWVDLSFPNPTALNVANPPINFRANPNPLALGNIWDTAARTDSAAPQIGAFMAQQETGPRPLTVGPGREFATLEELRQYIVARGTRGGNFANLEPGETIYVYPNIVNGRNVPHPVPRNGRLFLNANGTEDAPITLRGVIDEEGRRPIIASAWQPNDAGNYVLGIHSVLTVGSSPWGNYMHSGDWITVENLIIDGGMFEMFDFFNGVAGPGNRFYNRFGAPGGSGRAFSVDVTLENFPTMIHTPFENEWFTCTTRFGNRTYGGQMHLHNAFVDTPYVFMIRNAGPYAGNGHTSLFSNRAILIEGGDNVTVYNTMVIGGGTGIASADGGPGTIVIDTVEAAYNGMHFSGHNLYFNGDMMRHPHLTLTLRNSFIHNAIGTQGFRTRVGRNIVYNNLFLNNAAKQVDLVGFDAGGPPMGIMIPVYGYAQQFLGLESNQNIPHWESSFSLPQDTEFIGNVSIYTGPFHQNHVHIGGAGQVWEESWGRYRFLNNTFIHLADFGDGATPREAIGARFGIESVEIYNNVFYSNRDNFYALIEEIGQWGQLTWAFGERQIQGSHNWMHYNVRLNATRNTPGSGYLTDYIDNTIFGAPGEIPFVDLGGHEAARLLVDPSVFDFNIREDSSAFVTGVPVSTVAEFMTQEEHAQRLAEGLIPEVSDWRFVDGVVVSVAGGGWPTPYPAYSDTKSFAPWRGLGFGDEFHAGHWTWQPPVVVNAFEAPSNLRSTAYGFTWTHLSRPDSNAPLLGAFYTTVPELPEFGWHIFNNGPGGTQYPRPNAGLAASGTIRMWAQLDGVNAPVRLAAADTIVALDQNGQCAMEFVTVNQMWVAGTGWVNYFNMVNVSKDNGSWQYINLYITVNRQTVHVLLANALFVPPVLQEFSWDIFNNGPGGAPSRPNPGLAANGTIRMWARLDGVNTPVYFDAADTIVATDQDGENAMEFVRVNRMWVAGQGWANYFNLVDVNKDNGSWQYINLTITVYGETVHVLLVNALFEPPAEDVTVTFIVEAGAVGVYAATTTTVVVPAGEEIPASAIPNTEARTGFYFAGWYPSDPTGYAVTEDTTFTARFNPLFHYVTFEAGNGGEVVPAAGFGLVVNIRDGFTFWPERVPTPVPDAGYVFIGWYPADPAGFIVRDSMTFTALFAVPQIVSVLPNPAVVEQGGEVELVVTTQGIPNGAWVDMNIWRPGLSVVGGPRFYIVDNQATITVAAVADAQLGLDGFSVAARTAGDWGSVILIHSYAIVIEVI